jgi:hypothetical protein
VTADIVVKIRVARYEFARQAAVLGQVLDLLQRKIKPPYQMKDPS